jgi:SAM-dependent methyltransferase
VLRYQEFPFPLNALLHVLTREEADATAMHYGLFESPDESIAAAQERSTRLLLSRLPPPPRRLLEVGIGLGTTLARLSGLRYDAEGITPDAAQAAAARARFGDGLRIHVTTLEAFEAANGYDVVVFQESSQYIDATALFARVRRLVKQGGSVVVLDEFALGPVDAPHPLPARDAFLAAAAREGFVLEEELDLSRQAAPTVDYFLARLPRYRESIQDELGVAPGQIDGLLESGRLYRDLYRSGGYGYRLLRFRG